MYEEEEGEEEDDDNALSLSRLVCVFIYSWKPEAVADPETP